MNRLPYYQIGFTLYRHCTDKAVDQWLRCAICCDWFGDLVRYEPVKHGTTADLYTRLATNIMMCQVRSAIWRLACLPEVRFQCSKRGL